MLKPDGRILFATTYFCDLVGVNLEKVAEMSCFDFVFPGDMEAARELFMATKSQNQEPIRFRLRRLDGTEVWTDIQSTPMKAETGTVCAITATVTGAKGDR